MNLDRGIFMRELEAGKWNYFLIYRRYRAYRVRMRMYFVDFSLRVPKSGSYASLLRYFPRHVNYVWNYRGAAVNDEALNF